MDIIFGMVVSIIICIIAILTMRIYWYFKNFNNKH
jgi:hypothetical protein